MNRNRHGNRGALVAVLVIIVICLLAGGGFFAARSLFAISEVTIEGSTHYSYEELYEKLFENRNDKNMILYRITDSKAEPVEIPFIAKIDVEYDYPDRLHFTLYEKSMVGYVIYMGSYMYFDMDGVVVESSAELMPGVPYVSGLDYSRIVLYQKLDVSDETIFTRVQNLYQSLVKYGIDVDEIMIGEDNSFSIRLDEVKVLLGNEENSYSEKIYALSCLQSKLTGLSGTLNLEDYKGDGTYIFVSDAVEEESETEEETMENSEENAVQPEF